jgi:DNA-binding MarR family transcriptional regulator
LKALYARLAVREEDGKRRKEIAGAIKDEFAIKLIAYLLEHDEPMNLFEILEDIAYDKVNVFNIFMALEKKGIIKCEHGSEDVMRYRMYSIA